MDMNYKRYTDKETSKNVFETFNEIYKTGKSSKGFRSL